MPFASERVRPERAIPQCVSPADEVEPRGFRQGLLDVHGRFLQGGAPPRVFLPDPELLPELPGQARRAPGGEADRGDLRLRPSPRCPRSLGLGRIGNPASNQPHRLLSPDPGGLRSGAPVQSNCWYSKRTSMSAPRRCTRIQVSESGPGSRRRRCPRRQPLLHPPLSGGGAAAERERASPGRPMTWAGVRLPRPALPGR